MYVASDSDDFGKRKNMKTVTDQLLRELKEKDSSDRETGKESKS